MPNWCDNLIVLKGSSAALTTLRVLLAGPSGAQLSFTGLLPMPQDLMLHSHALGTPKTGFDALCHSVFLEKYGVTDWYAWALKYWGTKWDVDNTNISWREQPGEHSLGFSTAWSPATPFFAHAARQAPEVTFQLTFHEGGNCFAGYRTWEKGQLTAAKDYSNPKNPNFRKCRSTINAGFATS